VSQDNIGLNALHAAKRLPLSHHFLKNAGTAGLFEIYFHSCGKTDALYPTDGKIKGLHLID
jgi:hypothetical protein